MSFDLHAAYDELKDDDHDYRFHASLAERWARTAWSTSVAAPELWLCC
jgi:hypothetical protein